MIGRNTKALFYFGLDLPMWLNGKWKRLVGVRSPGPVKVHLGPGQSNYLPGWINVDANFISAKIDMWANLRHGLPFRNRSVDAFYSHHVIEHLPDSELPFHCRELFRCLKPGGVVRVGGPNSEAAAKKLLERDSAWFGDYPDKRRSVGGRYANFVLCRGEHLTLLTFSYWEELLSDAGFVNIRQCLPITETGFGSYFDQNVLSKEWESSPDCPHTLLVEAQKPLETR